MAEEIIHVEEVKETCYLKELQVVWIKNSFTRVGIVRGVVGKREARVSI